jgi:plastocyanin
MMPQRNTEAPSRVLRSVTKHLRIVAPLLATAALAAGCGGGYGDQDSTQTSSKQSSYSSGKSDTATKAKPAAAESAATIVEMTGSTFQPGDIDLKVGETVTFVNKDEIAHTATANGTFDSGTMDAGAKFTFTASKAGKISYVCVFHPGMTGTINVT